MTEQIINGISLKPSGRSKDEIFASLSNNIRKMYNNEISEIEAREAARNLISFGQRLMDLREKQQIRNKVLNGENLNGMPCEPKLLENPQGT